MAKFVPLRSLWTMACLAWAGLAAPGLAAELPEYQVKAAFLYNFALFTEWPAHSGNTITLCVVEGSALQTELEEFEGQSVGNRQFAVRRVTDAEATQGCQLLFLPRATAGSMGRTKRMLAPRDHLLVVGDSPEAAQAGAGINMSINDARVIFDVNLQRVQDAKLTLSSKLLRLARHAR